METTNITSELLDTLMNRYLEKYGLCSLVNRFNRAARDHERRLDEMDGGNRKPSDAYTINDFCNIVTATLACTWTD